MVKEGLLFSAKCVLSYPLIIQNASEINNIGTLCTGLTSKVNANNNNK